MAKLFLHSFTLTVNQLQPSRQGRDLYFGVMQQPMGTVTGFKDFNSDPKTVPGAHAVPSEHPMFSLPSLSIITLQLSLGSEECRAQDQRVLS